MNVSKKLQKCTSVENNNLHFTCYGHKKTTHRLIATTQLPKYSKKSFSFSLPFVFSQMMLSQDI